MLKIFKRNYATGRLSNWRTIFYGMNDLVIAPCEAHGDALFGIKLTARNS